MIFRDHERKDCSARGFRSAAQQRRDQSMAENENERTITFSLADEKEQEMKRILQTVYNALVEKGHTPINQIVGYILSEDPTYITKHNNARSLIRKIDRDELLCALVKNYLNI